MDTEARLRERIEAIVRSGADVPRQVADAVAAAAQHAVTAVGGLAVVVRATVAGGARAAADRASADPDGVLRQVVDGLGQGLATVAQAAELTLREATGETARFVRADLSRLAGAFRDVSRGFVDAVVGAAAQAGGHAGDELRALRDHATATLRRLEAPFAAAVAAATDNPTGLAQEAWKAGSAAARGAAGALCTALGKRLRELGVVLAPARRRRG